MSNSIITWTDEHGSGIRGLPKKVGQARYHRVTGEQHLPEDADPGDLALCEEADRPGGTPYVRMEDGWHRAREIQAVNETDEHEDLRTMDGSIVRVLAPTMRVSIQVVGMDPEPVRPAASAEPRTWHPPSQVSTPTSRVPEWECRACGAVSGDRELFDELGCSVR